MTLITGDSEHCKFDNDSLIKSIEELVEICRKIGILTSDFQAKNQNILNSNINLLVENLSTISKLNEENNDAYIPEEVIHYVDMGKSPELFTYDKLITIKKTNDQIHNKIESLKYFRTVLLDKFYKEFPEAFLTYDYLKRSKN